MDEEEEVYTFWVLALLVPVLVIVVLLIAVKST